MVRVQDLKNKLINKYRDIEPVYSPAFEAEVHYAMKGWKHVLGREKHQTRRRTSDVITRLELILDTPSLLARATTSTYRRQNNRDYFTCICKHPKGAVAIVIEKDKKGTYRFLSLFLKKKPQK